MALNTNTPFPMVPSLRTILSVKKNPVSGMPARGIEGLRPGAVTFDKTLIERMPDGSGWQPIAAIGAYELMPPTDPGGEPVIMDAFDCVSWWLMNVSYEGDPVSPLPSPPQIDFSFRGAFIGCSQTFSVVTTNLVSYKDTGLLVQVAGILCSQWEVWANIHTGQPAGSKVKVRLGGIADRMGYRKKEVELGTLVHV